MIIKVFLPAGTGLLHPGGYLAARNTTAGFRQILAKAESEYNYKPHVASSRKYRPRKLRN